MATQPQTTRPTSSVLTGSLPNVARAVWFGAVTVVALAIIYFIGVDQGMASVFGKSMMIHEWVHDARHFLGFPCH